jgi:hypothetical protein
LPSPVSEHEDSNTELQTEYPHDQFTCKDSGQKRVKDNQTDKFFVDLQRDNPREETATAYVCAAPRLQSAPDSPTPPSPTPTQTLPAPPTTPKIPTTMAMKPSSGHKKVKIELEEDFEWDRDSLILLFKYGHKQRRGARVTIKSGKFPGHTTQSIELVWSSHRAEAREAYEEVYEGKDIKRS